MPIYDPNPNPNPKPKARTGTCVVCSGQITEKFEWDHGPGPIKYGGPPRGWWSSTGLHCEDCGLLYHKLPKKKK